MSTAHKIILDFVIAFMLEHDYPPTVREIAEGVGYASTATVFYHMLNMRKAHLIDYSGDSPRTIRVPGYHYTYQPIEGRKRDGAGKDSR